MGPKREPKSCGSVPLNRETATAFDLIIRPLATDDSLFYGMLSVNLNAAGQFETVM